jgi:ABC-type bacteriocin/lantibiotic exporter with double-glycine peptidase domain
MSTIANAIASCMQDFSCKKACNRGVDVVPWVDTRPKQQRDSHGSCHLAKSKLRRDAEPGHASALPISMHNMGKRFGSTTVLRGIHLDIITGEVVVIGSSDSGKSTLSRRSISRHR